MSNSRVTFGLLVACLGCGLLLWVLNRPAMQAARPQPMAGRLFGASLREVDHLQIERNGLSAELRREPDGWTLTRPLAGRADQTVVQRLLDACERAARHATIEADELALRELTLADFGLLNPQARLLVAGPRTRAELLLGHATANSNELFACFGQAGEVLVTDRGVLDALPSDAHALRDRAFYRGDPRRVVALALRRAGTGFVRLARESGGWRLTQPLAARADDGAVQAILESLAGARIARFVWPPAGSATNDSGMRAEMLGFGLQGDESGVQIQVWEAGDPAGRLFRLGTPLSSLPDHVHALTPDGLAVVAVTGAVLRAAQTPLESLRDRRLFAAASGDVQALDARGPGLAVALRRTAAGDWELTAPMVDRADPPMVARLLDDLLHLRAESFEDDAGSLSPAATNAVLSVALTTARDAMRLVIEGMAGGGQARLSFTNAPTRYLVATSQLERVLGLLRDPSALRDRTVLAIPADGLRRITVRRADGRTQSLDRDAANAWRPSVPGETLERAALDGWLALLARLRALRVETPRTAIATNDTYGLAAPCLEVTLDLAAEDALRRVLSVGGTAPDGGRYAMVKGHDAVFVLDPETVRRMLLPLVRAAPATAPAISTPPIATPRETQ